MSETTTNRTNQSATTATLAGYEIPRLGMGTMALAIEGRPSNRNQAIETIHAALDAGVRYLDTAWSYYLPSAPGTGEPEDMGYGEYLVRDALHSWHGPKDQVLVATKTGWLRIQAYTGLGSGPAPGATAVISRQFADGVHVFATVQTDESGIADDIPLPAPDKSLAESPAGEAPYADYRITVTRPGYRTEVYTEVPVFDGIKSIQPVQLTPIKTNGAR